jgi:1-acyl-sn-glycerol-3-phosphate acyltransferase
VCRRRIKRERPRKVVGWWGTVDSKHFCTRIGPSQLQPFKKGFAHFAVEGGVPVVPVALSGKDLWLRKKIEVFVGEPISPDGKTIDEVVSLGEQAVRDLLPVYVEPPARKPLRRWLTGPF